MKNMTKMKPSEVCKSAGLKSLVELSELSGESVQTLNNWFKREPRRFELVLKGVLFEQSMQKLSNATRTISDSEQTNNESEISDLLCCPECGSGDVKKCQISVRPYCNECNYWGAINFTGTMQDAVNKWNNHPNRAT